MIRSIEHIAIVAADSKALARWYCDVLGFEMILENDESQTYFVRLPGGGILEFLPSNDRAPAVCADDDAGIRHIALKVDDFDSACRTLEERGAEFVGPYRETPTGTRFNFVADPEGNLLQIVYRPEPL
ncbi:MAG: VOC family protein [Gemmatimonadetes bacterium]|nr:VOC family protein [Gemmatimonadota bacterium]MDE3256527.1 VOC family protein [Gemmatimonadota bacterium]